MSLDPLLPAFASELASIGFEKRAFHATTPEMKAGEHFSDSDPNWQRFEKNLRSKNFQKAVLGHPESDSKLKKYVRNFGGFLTSKETVKKAPSESSGKKYSIKKVGRRLACGCKNWQYRRSVDGGSCKHIRNMKKESMAEMVKRAFLADLAHAATLADNSRRRAKKQIGAGQQSSAWVKQHQVAEQQSLLHRQMRDR
jgi:hypothetical protein